MTELKPIANRSLRFHSIMKDVFTLLLSKKNQDIKYSSQIREWFDTLDRSVDDEGINERICLVPHVLQVLRECLLSHRWHEAVKVLHGLSRKNKDTATTIWKVGLELLYTSPDTNGRLIDQLINQMKWCPDLNVQEVLLEYVIYLLDQGRLEDAGQVFMNVPKLRGSKKAATHRSDYSKVLFEAYHGLVWYVEWLNAKNQMEHLQDAVSGNAHLHGTPAACNYEELMMKHYQKAIECFQCLAGKFGIWDIFITKHVELLEYYSLLEDCQNLLENYVQCNPENPNSHKYLYQFCVRNNFILEKRKNVLKELAKHVPSDPLVLDLCEMLMADEDVCASLGYLFNLLDYSIWQQEERPWSLLSQVLLNVITLKRSDLVDCLDELWDIRSSWWIAYHFTCDMVDYTKSSITLLFHKAKCAAVLLGPGNIFSSDVKLHLNGKQKQDLMILKSYRMVLQDIT